jgi:hypothetical protein
MMKFFISIAMASVVCATGSLMSMEENKKQYFLIDDISEYVLPYDENKPYLKDRLSLKKSARKVFKQGCNNARKYGKGQALFIIDNRQVLAKISLVDIEGDNCEYKGYFLVKIKPWNKVNLLGDIQ